MKCFYCGDEISDTSKFCSNCGAKVEKTDSEVFHTESKYQSGVSAECYEVQPSAQVVSDTNNKNKSNGNFAIASLVCSLVGLVIPCCFLIPQILGIIFGVIGRKSDKKGMAVAGIIISAITIVFSIIITIIYFALIAGSMPDIEFENPYSFGNYINNFFII